jgi:hypothetical protein
MPGDAVRLESFGVECSQMDFRGSIVLVFIGLVLTHFILLSTPRKRPPQNARPAPANIWIQFKDLKLNKLLCRNFG